MINCRRHSVRITALDKYITNGRRYNYIVMVNFVKPVPFLQCRNGLPAILVYKGGQLVGNFIKVTDQLGHDFYAVEVEGFLQE